MEMDKGLIEQLLAGYEKPEDLIGDKILSLYARGMTTREIQGHLEEMYQVEGMRQSKRMVDSYGLCADHAEGVICARLWTERS